MTFDTYESGKLSLDEYLQRSVFCTDRPTTLWAFRSPFMFGQSSAYPEMDRADWQGLKARYKPEKSQVVEQRR